MSVKERFTINEEEKSILRIAQNICARVMNETNSGTGDVGPIFTEASLSVTALHTFLYYINQDDPELLRHEPSMARLKRFLEELDKTIGNDDYGLARTTMLQISDKLHDLFPELQQNDR